jgi:hypothetical protein
MVSVPFFLFELTFCAEDTESELIPISSAETPEARRTSQGEYSYARTALVHGREAEGRFTVIQMDREHTRVVRRRADGTAPGFGELVRTEDVFDVKPTRVV